MSLVTFLEYGATVSVLVHIHSITRWKKDILFDEILLFFFADLIFKFTLVVDNEGGI